MRRRLLVAPLTLALIVAIVGGSTTAQFTASTDVPQNEFCAGTVLIEAANVDGNKIIEDWEPGQCREVHYSVTNTGSKCLLLRARYDEEWYERDREFEKTGSAWGNIEGGSQYGQGQSQAAYFEYEKGSANATAPFTVELGEGANYDKVGTIAVWDDGDKLYVKFSSDDPTVMRKAHLYAGLEEPENTAPGRLGFGFEPHPSDCFSQHRFELPRIYEESPDTTGPVPSADYEFKDVDDNTAIYIAAHADVGTCKGTGEWLPWEAPDDVVSVEPCDSSWRKGNDGYLYYVGDNDCLEGVLSGETVELCLRVCLAADADSDYQDKLLRLVLTFEAVQCSNDAAHQLSWEFTCVAGSVNPTGGHFTAKAQANTLLHTGVWSQQSEGLLVHADDVALGESGHGPDTLLYGVDLENSGSREITIDRILVGWTSGQAGGDEQGSTDAGSNVTAQESRRGRDGGTSYSAGGNLTADTSGPASILEVVFSGEYSQIVWSGCEPSGTRLNISEHVLQPGRMAGMELVFDSSMAGRELTIAFIMSDGSNKAVSMGPLAGSAVSLGPDETLLDEEDDPEAETETDSETTDECETGEQEDCEGSCDDCGGGEADPVEEDSAGGESDSPGDEQQADGEDEASGDTDGDSGSPEPGAGEEDSAGNGDEDGSADDGDDAEAEEQGDTEDGNTGESDADPADDEDSTSGDTEADAEEGATGDDDADSSGEEPEADQEEGATEEDEDSTCGDTEGDAEEGAPGDDDADSSGEESEACREEDEEEEDEDEESTSGSPETDQDDNQS